MKILIGKKIFSQDKNNSIYEAIAFEKGKVIKLGNKNDLIKEFPKAEVITKYKDNYIYPSWVEPHSHIVYSAILLGTFVYIDMLEWDFGDVKYSAALSKKEFFKIMKKYIKKHPDQEQYMFYGWVSIIMGEFDFKAVKKITKKPVLVVSSSTHEWNTVNGMDDYLNLSSQEDNEFIEKDKKGNRTGKYSEQAALPALEKISELIAKKPEMMEKGLERVAYLFKKYGVNFGTEHAQGLSSIFVEDKIMEHFIKDHMDGKFKLVSLPWLQNWFAALDNDIEKVYNEMEKRFSNFPPGEKNNLFYDRWIKIHLDGAIKDEEVKLSMNFNNSNSSGSWNYTRMDNLLDDVKYFWDRGYSASFHTQGDGAFDKFMEIYDYITKDTPKGDKIFRLEHLGFAPDRFFTWLNSKDKNDKPEISGFSLYSYTSPEGFEKSNKIPKVVRDTLGRFRSVIDSGATLSLHTDIPNAPTNPLFTAWAAVTKKTIFGHKFNENEKITRQEAIDAITKNAASMTRVSSFTGSLEPGKNANINVLPFDLFECDIDEWKEMPSIQTYYEGEEIK